MKRQTGLDPICIDKNVDLLKARAITDRCNIPLTFIMLHDAQQGNMKYVVNLLDIAQAFDQMVANATPVYYVA